MCGFMSYCEPAFILGMISKLPSKAVLILEAIDSMRVSAYPVYKTVAFIEPMPTL